MSYLLQPPVNSVCDFVSTCMTLRSEGFWAFRGQRKEDWHLGLHNADLDHLDENLEQFKKRCVEFRFLDFLKPEDQWHWLFYAQHHRLKTRLLDWTSNPLVALYYAVENILSHGDDDKDFGAVWAIQVHPRHFLPYDKLPRLPNEIKDIKEWIMVNPLPVTHRLARQSGKFSYHPDSTPLDLKDRRPEEELRKYPIGVPGGSNPAREIRRQLGIMNVHYAQMFLNPDGIARFINWEWRELQKPENSCSGGSSHSSNYLEPDR